MHITPTTVRSTQIPPAIDERLRRITGHRIGGYHVEAMTDHHDGFEWYRVDDPEIQLLSQAPLSRGDADALRRWETVRRVLECVRAPGLPELESVITVRGWEFLALRTLAGGRTRTLAQELAERRALTANEVLAMLRDLGGALQTLTAANISFRALSLQTVRVRFEQGQRARFELALPMEAQGGPLVGPSLAARPMTDNPWAGPEQRLGVFSAKTDLHALAALAYGCLLGLPAGGPEGIAKELADLRADRARLLSRRVPRHRASGIEGRLDALRSVLARAVREEPAGRQACIGTLLAEVEQAVVVPATELGADAA